MALVVEDGTGLVNAESFASVLFVDTFYTNLNDASWAGTTAEKEAALRQATNWIEENYGTLWDGVLNTDTQALSWPRTYVRRPSVSMSGDIYLDSNVIPNDVQIATAYLAKRALSVPLTKDAKRAIKREKVEGIEREFFNDSAPMTTYTDVVARLDRYVAASSSGSRVYR